MSNSIKIIFLTLKLLEPDGKYMYMNLHPCIQENPSKVIISTIIIRLLIFGFFTLTLKREVQLI